MASSAPSVLIVDDYEPDVVMARITLRKAGRFGEVWSVNSGEAVVGLFRDWDAQREAHPHRFPPALVLLDINMPGLNGFDVLDALAGLPDEHRRSTRVVMLTSSLRSEDRERARRSPLVVGYESKPLSRASALGLLDLLE
jgi:CheY-like chemotaxis protein